MIVAFVESPHDSRTGDWFYRTHLPGLALAAAGARVVETNFLHQKARELCLRADVLVLNMSCDPDLLPLVAVRRAEGRPTVFELNDDVAFVQPANPLFAFFSNAENRRLLRLLAASCDALQFSSAALAARYGYLNGRHLVFPNHLPGPLPPLSPRPAQGLVVGWGGSVGHRDDLAAVAGPLGAWVKQRPDVRLAVMADPQLRPVFAACPEAQLHWVPPGPMERYTAFLQTLDVGLAPLMDTGFNRCRSDVKLLEYAAHGAVPVVQRLAPYEAALTEGLTGFGFRDTGDLLTILSALHQDPKARGEVARSAYRYVSTQRLMSQNVDARLAFYEGLWASGAPARPSDNLFEDACAWPGAEPNGNHVRLGFSAYERLVYEALVTSQAREQTPAALPALRAAEALLPSEGTAARYLALFEPETRLARLEGLARRVSTSLSVWIDLGDARFDAGQVAGALEAFKHAARLAPRWSVPLGRLAAVLASQGAHAQAESFAVLARQNEAAVPEPL